MKYCIEVHHNRTLINPLIPEIYELEAKDINEAYSYFEKICEENKYKGDLTFEFSVSRRPYLEVKDELCSLDGCFEKHNDKLVKWYFETHTHGKNHQEGKYCEECLKKIEREDTITSIEE